MTTVEHCTRLNGRVDEKREIGHSKEYLRGVVYHLSKCGGSPASGNVACDWGYAHTLDAGSLAEALNDDRRC